MASRLGHPRPARTAPRTAAWSIAVVCAQTVTTSTGSKTCDHCGGACRRTGTERRNGRLVALFRCIDPLTPGCDQEQSQQCDTDALLFGLVARDEELNFELRGGTNRNKSNAHALSRARHATLGDSLPIQPKRIGTGAFGDDFPGPLPEQS